MAAASDAKRTRLSPEDRRTQLLDRTRDLIQVHGLSGFTMEALAKSAGVSNPLVYKYFDSRLALLQELLAREYDRFNAEIRSRLADAEDYRAVVRVMVEVNFDQASRGDVMHILRDQADVRANQGKAQRREGRRLARFLVRELAEQYPRLERQAEELVVLASGASRAAAGHFARHGGDRAELVETTVNFIFGGMQPFADEQYDSGD